MLIRPGHLIGSLQVSASPTASALVSNTSCHTTIARPRRCRRGRHNTYATIADSEGRSNQGTSRRHDWPSPPKGHTCPTPYQIFAIAPHDAYTKARFYELVKLYHPDRSLSQDGRDSTAQRVKVERYRLIVAAHSILSDPEKRSAYDRFGVGWHGEPDLPGAQRPSSRHRPAGPFSHNWHDHRDAIWQNATWEDWERFYQARRGADPDRHHQSPQYLQNTYFIALVATLAAAGGLWNYTTAHQRGQSFVERRDIVHDQAAKELRRVRSEKNTMGDRQDRIQWFSRVREATMAAPGSDPDVLREEATDRVLPRRDVCSSDDIEHR